MAQSTEDIYQDLLTEKEAKTELSGLDSPSNTSIWQLWLRLSATFMFWMETKWDLFKAEVQAVIDANQFGTFEWWNKKIKGFQYGDALQFVNNRFVYATDDTTKQIVHFVSVTDERGIVKIKAAKILGDRPDPLSSAEAAGLLSYGREIRPPGTRVVVESLPADRLRTKLIVHYNAQIGEATIKTAVEAAYLNYINNIVFDGYYFINKMIDELQVIPGVIEEQVEVVEIAAKQGTDPYVQFTAKYQAVSGYYEIDPDFPLADTISYIGV